MCGIVGILGNHEVVDRIYSGLARLEYRGYDSSGIAVLKEGDIDRRRAVGKLGELQNVLSASPLSGNIGIGHTRWATHGKPTEKNAHPHVTEKVGIVHNGIIENFAILRDELTAKGYNFNSETDTEVIAALITTEMKDHGLGPVDAFAATLKRLEGAFGLAVIFKDQNDLLLCARRGSPLVVGRGDGEMFVGSDAYAISPYTNRVTYLEENDWAVIRPDSFQVYTIDGKEVTREEVISSASPVIASKGQYNHFMEKEIHEQPEVVGHTISGLVDPLTSSIQLPENSVDFRDLNQLTISACGTAYYAGVVAKYWFEEFAKLRVEVDIASELRYRHVPYAPGGAALFVSQSGETADTLAALRAARNEDQKILAIVNVPESTIAREADFVFQTHAGPEIGVASTKAFTCQLTVLFCLAVAAGVQRGHLTKDDEKDLVTHLLEVPRIMSQALQDLSSVKETSQELVKATDVLFLGRGISFPLALEGALKLKEISYIHAEGYAAGELKHGPIALIDEDVPVVVVAPFDGLFEKTVSNMHEVMARGGRCILISSAEGIAKAEQGGKMAGVIQMDDCDSRIAPLVYALPLQLLSYYTAFEKGTDVDQPRNLAKSVTVE
jgi:glucosamine--fructose-6-phosphate aminotransferase (isomerizing)